MGTPLNVLILEDRPADAELMLHELRKAGYDPSWQRVETDGDFRRHLDPALDIILADYNLPQFTGLQALEILSETDLDIPFIVVTGTIEDAALECMRRGAVDYLLKDRLGRLGPAVKKALEERMIREDNKLANEALRASEQRYRGVAETALTGIATVDSEERITYTNPAFAEMLGYSSMELLGMSLSQIVEPEEFSAIKTQTSIRKKGLRTQYETTLKRKEGDSRTVIVSSTPLTSKDGAYEGAQAVITDITERVRAEREVQQRTEDLTLINTINIAINRGENLPEIMQLLTEEAKRVFNSQSTTVYLVSKDQKYLEMQNLALQPAITKRIEKLIGTRIPDIRIPLTEGSLSQELLLADGPRLINDAEFIQSWMMEFTQINFFSGKSRRVIRKLISQIYKLVGVQSIIAVPLVSAGKPIGLMDFSRREPFIEEDTKRVADIAGQVTAAIRRVQVEDEKSRSQRLLLALSQAAPAVQRASTPEAVYRAIGEQAGKMGFDATVFTLSEDQAQLIISYYSLNLDLLRAITKLTGLSPEGYRFSLIPDGYFHNLITSRETIFSIFDIKPIEEILPRPIRSLASRMLDLLETRQTIIAPLVIGGEVQGLLTFTGSDLSESDVPAITTFANQAAIAIENTRLFSETQELAAFNEDIVQSMAEGIVFEDAEGFLTFVNPAAASLLGYTPEELAGMHWKEIVFPGQEPIVQAAIERRMLGHADHYELELICKDGRRVSALVSGNPRNDKEGHFTGTMAVFTDITEIKRAEEQISRFGRIFEDSLNEIYLFETDSLKFTQVNSAAQNNLGYSMEELQELTPPDIKPEFTAELFEKVIAPLRKGETGRIVFETVHKRKDQSLYDVEVHLQLLKYEHETLFAAIIMDITERKRAQEQRAIHLERMEILRQIDLAISGSLDLSTTLEVLLDQITQRLGIDAADVLLFDPDQQHLQRAAGRGFKTEALQHTKLEPGEGYAGQVMANRETLFVPDLRQEPGALLQSPLFESEGFISYISAPLIAKDEVKGVIELFQRTEFKPDEEWFEFVEMLATQAAIAIDNATMYRELEQHSTFLEQAVEEATDELRHSAEQLETILNNSPNTVLLLTPEGIIRLCNSAVTQTFGYMRDEIRSGHVRDLVDDSMADSITSVLKDVLTADNARRIEILAIRKDKTTFDAVMNLAAIQHDNEVNAIVCTIMDISPLKAAERAKDAFVSNVSHELRTPITSLRLNHNLLKRDPGEPKYLDRFDREITRLNELIEDLLRLSRLDQGQVELNIEPVDLNDLFAETAQDRVVLAESHDLELVVIRQEANIPLVQADANLLGQVLSVLLTNAIHYTPAGGVIEVRAVHEERDGASWAGFHVRDDGLGISSNDLPHLFERFYRGKVGRKSGAPGTGLGLSIASEIVKRHHGHIDVESKGVPGEGTTFTVWLPAVIGSVKSEK